MSRRGAHRMLLRQLERQALDRSDVENEEEEEEIDEIEDEEADISGLGSNAAAAGARTAVDSGEEDDAAVDEDQDREELEQELELEQDQEQEQDLFEQVAAANPGILQPIRGQGLGRDDWGDGATLALLQAWGDKCMALNKWHLRLDHWAELAAAVTIRSNSPKTDVQCKNRVDTLKKKFKQERHKQSSLGCASKWPFYRILDRLLGMASVTKSGSTATPRPRIVSIASNGDRAAIAPSLPIGADAGKILRNSGRSKRQHCRSSSDEQNRDERDRNGGESCGDDDDQEDEDQDGDPFWVFRSSKKRGRAKRKRRDDLASSSTLASAIAELGQIFERMEQCKRQQLADLEKIRLQFTKDLELHRMQLLMQTQMELAKIKHSIDMDDHLSA